jgi:hypothetical protein
VRLDRGSYSTLQRVSRVQPKRQESSSKHPIPQQASGLTFGPKRNPNLRNFPGLLLAGPIHRKRAPSKRPRKAPRWPGDLLVGPDSRRVFPCLIGMEQFHADDLSAGPVLSKRPDWNGPASRGDHDGVGPEGNRCAESPGLGRGYTHSPTRKGGEPSHSRHWGKDAGVWSMPAKWCWWWRAGVNLLRGKAGSPVQGMKERPRSLAGLATEAGQPSLLPLFCTARLLHAAASAGTLSVHRNPIAAIQMRGRTLRTFPPRQMDRLPLVGSVGWRVEASALLPPLLSPSAPLHASRERIGYRCLPGHKGKGHRWILVTINGCDLAKSYRVPGVGRHKASLPGRPGV